MASLRRTKNFATDPQTPIFLYNILKQLDLRSIDWNKVASTLGISNGHAARMRYSRMKTQFEGGPQPKTPKPKKDTEKEKVGEKNSTKEKARNKRPLEENQTGPLVSQQDAFQHANQQGDDSKRIKLEPHTYNSAWVHPMMNPVGQYASPFWSQPMIELEPMPSDTSTPSSSNQVSSGPDSSPATNTPLIKQEPGAVECENDKADMDVVRVKKEPGTNVSDNPPVDSTSCANSVADSYPNATPRSLEEIPRSSITPFGVTPAYSMSHSAAVPAYPPFHGLSNSHLGFSWFTPDINPSSTAFSFNGTDRNLTLNPFASSYEDMLSMPLYNRFAQPSDQHPGLLPMRQEHGADFGMAPLSTATPTNLCGNVEGGAGGANLSRNSSRNSSSISGKASANEPCTHAFTVSEAESASENEGEVSMARRNTSILGVGSGIKTEPVEL